MMWLWLAACTLGPGGDWSELTDVSVRVVLEPGPARDLGDHTVLTDEAYRVALDVAVLSTRALSLDALRGGGVTFDPAAPTAPFTNCHGGHCHHDDGSLWSYAEVEAFLAGSDTAFVPVVDLAVDTDFDLLAGDSHTLAANRSLPRVDVRRARVGVDTLVLAGTVTGGDLPEGASIALTAAVSLEGDLSADLDLPIDRTAPERFSLSVDVVLDGTLFDGLPLSALAMDGTVDLGDQPTLGDGVLAVEPVFTVHPEDL